MLTLLATFTLIVGLFLTFFPPGGQVKFSNFYCRTLYLISTQYFFYLSLMNQILPWQLLESGPSGTYLNRSNLRLHPGCTALIKPACRCWKGSKFWWCHQASICSSFLHYWWFYSSVKKQLRTQQSSQRAGHLTTLLSLLLSPASQRGRKKYDWININLVSSIWIRKQTRKFLLHSRSFLYSPVGCRNPWGKKH